MPCGSQKAITLSFSKKNEDVANIIQNYKEKDKNFVQNDYVCAAIRFYEKYKNSNLNNSLLQKEEILNLVDNRVKELLENSDLIKNNENNDINTILEDKTKYLTEDDLEED